MQLRISLASPEQMRQWSSGEVTQATTLHYRTHQPEPDGLFCQRIFGPVKDWTCACSPSVRARDRESGQRGTRCPRCGVLRGESRLRRERMGHLELAAPVAHPWFAHGSPSVLSLLLGLSQAHLETVLAYAGYLVLPTPEKERHHAPVETADALQQAVGSYLDERTVRDLREQDREQQGFPACLGTGPEAVHTVLAHLDLPALAQEVRAALHDAPDEEQAKRLSKRLQVIEALRHSGIRPEWMILTVVPVLPPDLRPILVMDGNRIASADVNTLYERVLHRTQRIRQFEERGAPTLLLHQEKRALQHSVEALLDNGHSSHPVTNARRQRLKSLTDSLAGKRGRFRLNLLGKRVDYSGRSVIVGNPRLKLHQCGLPKIMACELFKPFVMRKLVDRHLARTLRHAKRLVERRDPVIWDQLAECLYERVVLLNRAPTLHRLSIQAFEPVLIEGKALQLHPQVCSSFNADFDGDQMAVHVPLSDVAQAEARALLLSTHNLRSPANGDPSITISQEQVLGLYYLTEERPSDKRAGRIFVDTNEARLAYEQGIIDLHTPIVVRLADQQSSTAPGEAHPLPARGRLETTVGRLLFNEALPDALRYKNYAMTKDALKQLIAESLACCGDEVTATLADALKTLGFSYATTSGISFAMSDIAMPPERETLIAEGQRRWNEASDLLRAGEITNDEWYRQTITLWTAITDRIADTLKDVLPPFGTMMTIVKSGATKAKFQQIRQLSGIRGLLASPSGRIIPQPVLSNYLLGMLVWEIFIAARAARKGFMDRSLNTAPSGYLTRKLVETGMPLWITMADCGTHEGLLMTAALGRRAGYADLRPLLVGRVLAEPVAHLPEGTLLTEQMVDALLAQGRNDGIRIRSPLTCQAEVGLCQQCYGRDLATGKLVKRGVAVGVIAGQSIGEPGTQLTMRTFHSGGVANAQGDITQGMPRVSELFEARTPKRKALLARIAGRVALDEAYPERLTLVTETTLYDDYPLPPAATILVREQERVDAGQILAHSTHGAIQSRYAATVEQVGDGGITLRGEEQEEHGYTLPAGMQWIVQAGQQVEVGTPLSSGAIDPHELLSLCGVEAVARSLVSDVQAVYRTSGASLSDKHPETIVRQMLHAVRVVEEGDTDLIPGAIIPRTRFARETAAVLAQGGRPALACPVLLGLTQTVLATESWVVAASFQQTARVLTQAALRGQLDPLVGLKEHVMVGLPIPTPV